MFCPECGTKIPDDALFCPVCGTRIEEDPFPQNVEETPAPPVPPVRQAEPVRQTVQNENIRRTPQNTGTGQPNLKTQSAGGVRQGSLNTGATRQPAENTRPNRQPAENTQPNRQPAENTRPNRQTTENTRPTRQTSNTGTNQRNTRNTSNTGGNRPTNRQNVKTPVRPSGGGKNVKIAVIAIIIVAAAAIGAFFFLSNRRTVVDLNKYLKVTVSGYDGSGTASAVIDVDRLVEENPDLFKVTDKNRSKLTDLMLGVSTKDYGIYGDLANELVGGLVDDSTLVTSFLKGEGSGGVTPVSGYLDVYENIKNGDVIHFYWEIDDKDVGDIFKVSFSYSDMEYEIQGLY